MTNSNEGNQPENKHRSSGSMLKRLVSWLSCQLGRHDRVLRPDDWCEENRAITGIFRPWVCATCGHESQTFEYPPPPPIPGCKPPKTEDATIETDAVDFILNNMASGIELSNMLDAGWTIMPCSCTCGGRFAWMKPRENGAHEMFGCVCHKTGDALTQYRIAS